MRSDKRKTEDFDGLNYSPELIRELSDPQYAKEEEQYERQARRRSAKNGKSARRRSHSRDDRDENLTMEDLLGDFAPSGSASEQNIFEEDSDDAQGRRARAKASRAKRRSDGKKKKKKYKVNKKTMARNILSLVLIFALVGTAAFYYLTRTFDKVDTTKGQFAINSQVAKDLSGYRNIAILGVDARADEGYDGSRTDAIIIMSIKKTTGDIRLISVMRDSYLRMGYFDGEPILDKITHAHHYSGAVNTCASLNQSLDLNIDEFIIFNWKAVADAVDCLGGVDIKVKKNEKGDMNIWG